MAGALAGIRVLELAEGVSGPYCGKLLAGLGADVIKVEPLNGDRTRRDGPFPGDAPNAECSGLFLHLNTGKRSTIADLATGEGTAVTRLLPGADVVITSLRPAELAAAKIDLDAWRAEYPALVIASVTGFGLNGPYADYRGGELITYSLGGYAMLTGSPDREPLKAYGSLVEYQAGAQLALGVMAALLAREVTGTGQVVDCAAMQAATFLLGAVEQGAHFYGRIHRRNGTRLLGFPPEHSYPSTIRPCADGYVHCHSNNRFLDLLGVLIPHPRLAAPDLLSSMMGHADEVDAIMDEWLADKTREAIVSSAQELRLPFTEVREPGEVMSEPHHRERGSFVTIEHPGRTRPAAGSTISDECDALDVRSRADAGPTLRRELDRQRNGPDPAGDAEEGPEATFGPPRDRLHERCGGTDRLIHPCRPRRRGDQGGSAGEPTEGCRRRCASSRRRRSLFVQPDHDFQRTQPRQAQSRARCRDGGGTRAVPCPGGEERCRGAELSPRVMGNLGIDFRNAPGTEPPHCSRFDARVRTFGATARPDFLRARIDAMSGLSHLTGYADGPPMKPGNFFCDQQAGVLTAFAVCAALRHVERTGEGQHLELAMIEGEFQVLGDAYIDYAMNGRERRRTGNDHPAMEPHGMFRCRGEDAWVAIAVEDEREWMALCNLIGRTEMAARYAGAAARRAARGDIAAAITAWTEGRTHYEAQAELQAAGIAAGAVLNAAELLTDPHVRAYSGFEYVETPGVGRTPYPRVAFRLSATPVPVSGPAPGFGEANDYILRELLDIPTAEVDELRRCGVVADEPTGVGH
ncbi:CoA transferase [Candidatus Amarobacter glycogenicus]|uniref:CaiB/BaiF CoA-transferase family protein n=1 Tax=Candidatus Amarobacter glycogenicus TaxID=3140699 RepID=UPI0031CCC7AA